MLDISPSDLWVHKADDNFAVPHIFLYALLHTTTLCSPLPPSLRIHTYAEPGSKSTEMLDGQEVWLVWQHAALVGEEAWRPLGVFRR